MSIEQFPIKEKLATDLDTQIAWLAREMGYSRDKTKGYEEKLIRLTRSPEDSQSVFEFMGGYWHRFNMADQGLRDIPEQAMVSRALQAGAKVVAGVADKVAFALWLQSKADGEMHDSEWLVGGALESIRQRVNELKGQRDDETLLSYIGRPFEENPMGSAVLLLHESFARDPYNTLALHEIALNGAAEGILIWQAYGRSLAHQGYYVEMPMPGASSGNIEPWV